MTITLKQDAPATQELIFPLCRHRVSLNANWCIPLINWEYQMKTDNINERYGLATLSMLKLPHDLLAMLLYISIRVDCDKGWKLIVSDISTHTGLCYKTIRKYLHILEEQKVLRRKNRFCYIIDKNMLIETYYRTPHRELDSLSGRELDSLSRGGVGK